MRILWITNIPLPPISRAMGMKPLPVGGWMFSSLRRLCQLSQQNHFAVATVWSGKEFVAKNVDGVLYYLLPLHGRDKTKYNNHLEDYWTKIRADFRPDIVHIHGTEFPHGLAYIRACGSAGAVASIQGIISAYARYYAAGIDAESVKKSLTFRDIVKRDSIIQQQNVFYRRGKLEGELFKSISHVIGRTDWDKAHAKAMNPNAKYHFCGETLRDSFYKNRWSYENCEPYSIFTSQAGYPIKGLHMLIKALPLILRRYPESKVYVSGSNIVSKPFYRISGYGKYLKRLMSETGTSDKVIFTGPLMEEEMCRRYLKSNVFVCPSSIENSPNSLGEAQLLGMPYVASYVGGVPEIVGMNPEVLYRYEEYEMLAEKICARFEAKGSFNDQSDLTRYDGEQNTRELMDIYSAIFSQT